MSSSVSASTPKKSQRKIGLRRQDNIRQRGNIWQVRLVVNGEKVTKTFATKEEGPQWLDLKRGDQLDGDLGEFHKAQHLTLRSAIVQYRDYLLDPAREAPEQQQLSRLKSLAERAGIDMPLLEVMPNEIEALFAGLKAKGPRGNPLGANTMRLYFAALSSVYKHFIFGKQWQFLPSPLTGIKRPEPGPARTRRLVDDEENRIVSALTEYGPAYALTFMLLISTTMRMGELFSLTWSQFDEERSRIDIEISKTGARECPLSIEAIELLTRLPRINDLVIPITRDAFEMAWKRIMPRLNIKNLRRHDMRREGLTRWGQRGIDIVNLMRISGHKTMSQAQKYLVGTTDQAIDAMNGKFGDDPYLKHREIKREAPKPSLLRHFYAEVLPTNSPSSSALAGIGADARQSNVVAFPGATVRALVAPTRRVKARQSQPQ